MTHVEDRRKEECSLYGPVFMYLCSQLMDMGYTGWCFFKDFSMIISFLKTFIAFQGLFQDFSRHTLIQVLFKIAKDPDNTWHTWSVEMLANNCKHFIANDNYPCVQCVNSTVLGTRKSWFFQPSTLLSFIQVWWLPDVVWQKALS